jgi:hypothetical protein
MANFSNVFSTANKIPFSLAATDPSVANTFQGYRNLNINQIPSYISEAQKGYEERFKNLVKTGGEIGSVFAGGALGESPVTEYNRSLLRREEAEIARQARKEDIAALIEQKRVFDKEKAERDFKNKMIADIPQTISQSLGNVAALNALAGREITSAYSNTLANYPRPQFSTFNFQPEKYFG